VKVAFVTPELLSLARRTSLAEISEFLPRTLIQLGVEVRLFLPFHKDIELERLTDLTLVGAVEVSDCEGTISVDVHVARLGELSVVLIDHPELFRSRHPYGSEEGPYPDNWRRYAVFSRAVLEALRLIDFKPDVLHCLDWTTGLLPVIHHFEIAGDKSHPAGRAGTYFGIHNLAIQGSFEREVLPKIGLSHELFQSIEGIELGGKVNFLKGGAEFATVIGTHSPSMAQRVQTLDRGDGLEATFRRRKKELVGVLSGIDYRAWDPSSDPLLAQSFSAGDKDPSHGKRKCKSSLQSGLSLDNGPRTPLVTILGRFDTDSGFDILAEALTPMLERNLQLVLMGPGSPEILERMRTVEQTFTGRCRVIEGYNVNTAHTLLGGADMLILPAHYHASNALCAISMRYGVVPVVYSHSGLEDTVIDATTHAKTGTGVLFPQYTSDSLLDGIDVARGMYKKPADWKAMVARCLEQDFSWQESGRNYLKAYRRVTRRVRGKK
jgi:starch synthase